MNTLSDEGFTEGKALASMPLAPALERQNSDQDTLLSSVNSVKECEGQFAVGTIPFRIPYFGVLDRAGV